MARPRNSIARRLWNWFVERTKVEPFLTSHVPNHATNPMYCLGGITFLLFVILAATGTLLAMHYQPSSEGAYDSILRINQEVPYGWLVRSVHFYAANGMILTSILHMLRVYFTGSYRAPRELNWTVGVVLGAVTLMAGFTGYVLRWDQLAAGASSVGLGLANSIPIMGSLIGSIFWGRSFTQTLNRFFASHILLIPGLIILLVLLHFYMIRRHGIAEPL